MTRTSLTAAFRKALKSKDPEGDFQKFYNQFYYEKTLREARPEEQDRLFSLPARKGESLPSSVAIDSYAAKLVFLHREVLRLQPKRACEVGVWHGFSSYAILTAMAGRKVLSIDSERLTENGEPTGHLVDRKHRRGWALKIGKVEDVLPDAGKFDFIFHDLGIATTEENIGIAFNALAPGGTLFFSSRTVRPETDLYMRDHGLRYAKTAEGLAKRHLRPVASWGIVAT